MRDAADAGGRPRRYRIVESERVEADRESAFLRLLSYDTGYAARWLEDLNRIITDLPNFPGPRSHAVDAEATARFGSEVRRMLYFGPTRRRSGTPYRILFTVVEPPEGEDEGILRVLRILHGARPLAGEKPGEQEEDR